MSSPPRADAAAETTSPGAPGSVKSLTTAASSAPAGASARRGRGAAGADHSRATGGRAACTPLRQYRWTPPLRAREAPTGTGAWQGPNLAAGASER